MALTVKEYDPAGVVLALVVIVKLAIPLPEPVVFVSELGLNEADVPVATGLGDTLRSTVQDFELFPLKFTVTPLVHVAAPPGATETELGDTVTEAGLESINVVCACETDPLAVR